MIGWYHAAVVQNEVFFLKKQKTQTNKNPTNKQTRKEKKKKRKKDQTSLAVTAKILVEGC